PSILQCESSCPPTGGLLNYITIPMQPTINAYCGTKKTPSPITSPIGGRILLLLRHTQRHIYHHLHSIDEAVLIHAEFRMMMRIFHVFVFIPHADPGISRGHES